jgi:shikimate dehydrogenase
MQNAAIEAHRLDAVYVALRSPDELVAALMRSVAEAGGGGNVTVPHKRVAARSLDNSSESVLATGACNVFWWQDDRGLCGDNTDVSGFITAADTLLEASLAGSRVLLLGAGGAARAVAYACLSCGAERVDLANRTPDKAEALYRDLGEPAEITLLRKADGFPSAPYDLVVNATALGLDRSDPLPIDPTSVGAAAVMDLVYGAADTRFVRAAREAGLRAEDGRRMLVEQAAESFRRWFDLEPPRNRMYEAVGLTVPNVGSTG